MTDAEIRLEDEKLRAEVSKLITEAKYSDDRIQAEIHKMVMESNQIRLNMFLAPFLAAAGLMGATAAVVKLFF